MIFSWPIASIQKTDSFERKSNREHEKSLLDNDGTLHKTENKRDMTSKITPLDSAEAVDAIWHLQELLRFETVSATAPGTGEYKRCAAFLIQQLSDLPMLENIHILKEAPDHSPVVVAKWKGIDSNLPVLLLNSHYDVVPADESAWTVAPFKGVRQDGKIYGRGAQDMKCVCIQYIEAIRKIAQLYPDWQPTRDIYLTFVPDEEIGGSGMAAFLDSALYKSLPGIALALDEGLASTTNTFDVFYGERLRKCFEFDCF